MSPIISKSLEFVKNLLSQKLDEKCTYHNLDHTVRVFNSTKEITDNSNLNEEEGKIVQLAALFHDVGFTINPSNHEYESTIIASKFLKEHGEHDSLIEKVKACILITKMGEEPKNKLENIIKDADVSHFGKDNFEEVSEQLRNELKLLNSQKYSKSEWNTLNLKVLNEHKFYSAYSQENWNSTKEENIKKIMEDQIKNIGKEEKRKLKELMKNEDPEKAVQSVFRITLKNHIKLSDIADTKANILLSVNAIIISIALSSLIPKLDNPSNSHLIIPTLIFLLFTVITIILSVLATRPNVTGGKFTKKDVSDKKVNLLFFGNFYKMTLEEYDWAMNEMLQDKMYIYSSMTKDLYFLGIVLQKKYALLRVTYNIFMTGIIVSVVSFAVAFYNS
jgi:HD superfamily phosphodiesterase